MKQFKIIPTHKFHQKLFVLINTETNEFWTFYSEQGCRTRAILESRK